MDGLTALNYVYPGKSTLQGEKGVSLTELMIAVALIGIGIIGGIGAFNLIMRSITYSKAATLATNLAQEKMQILMQKSYFEILVTTSPAYDTDFTPNLPYDSGYFPPETVLEGSILFTRLTYVQVVQDNNGVLQTLSPSTPDTGMRRITVYVIWNSVSGKHYITLQNVINNPNTVMSDVLLKGQAADAVSSAPIASALVGIAENTGWRDNTNSAGNYTLHVSPGNFHLTASALGYSSTGYFLSFAPNNSYTQNITLMPISTGTISGTAWLDNHVVISQVVASTGAANDIEYVELYNPTTSAFVIGTNATFNNPNFWPVIWDKNNNSSQRHLFYVNTTIPSHGYFLISNTGKPSDPSTSCSTFTAAGTVISPDACWLHAQSPHHAIECNTSPCPLNGTASSPDAGGVSLFDSGGVTGNRIDSVGWAQSSSGDAAPAGAVEGTSIVPLSGGGLTFGEQFVRKSDTGTMSLSSGRAYDANINSTDFVDILTVNVAPNTSAAAPQTPVSGTPASGADISVTDGNSSSVKAVLMGNPPYALFSVPGVATGTWTAFVDSGTSSAEIDNIVIVQNSTTSIPNAATSPVWPGVGENAVILSTADVNGIISGYITDVAGNPPSAWSPSGVNVSIAGQIYPVNAANGHYSVRLGTGTYDVTANPDLGNASYGTQTQSGITIPNGGDETANINFQLSQGGKLSGWVTRDGINPLPGVSVVALDANGNAHDTEVSATNGSFTLINLTTGTYTVQPILDPKEISTPASNTATVVAGTNVSVGTFTVLGAMGTVTGTVAANGNPIQSGVLIIISAASVSLPPPAISSNTLTGSAYYQGSSHEDGAYSVQVRGSTTTVYNIVGLYMRLNGQTPVISSQTITGVAVTAGQTTSGKNFAW